MENRRSFSRISRTFGVRPEFQGEPDRQPYSYIVRTCALERGRAPGAILQIGLRSFAGRKLQYWFHAKGYLNK